MKWRWLDFKRDRYPILLFIGIRLPDSCIYEIIVISEGFCPPLQHLVCSSMITMGSRVYMGKQWWPLSTMSIPHEHPVQGKSSQHPSVVNMCMKGLFTRKCCSSAYAIIIVSHSIIISEMNALDFSENEMHGNSEHQNVSSDWYSSWKLRKAQMMSQSQTLYFFLSIIIRHCQ